MFSKSTYKLIPKFDDTEVKNHGFVYLTEDVKSNEIKQDASWCLHGMQRSAIQVSPVAANKEQWHSFKY